MIEQIVFTIWLGILAVEDVCTRHLLMGHLLLGVISVAVLLVMQGNGWNQIWFHLGGAICGGSFLVLGKCTKQAIGYGDGIVLLILGTYLGAWKFLWLCVYTFTLCGIYISVYIIMKCRKRELMFELPFVPFLLGGYAIQNYQSKNLQLKGSATIEMLYIIPVILLVFIVAVYISFFFHDKNVLQSLAYETAVIGSSQYREGDGVQEEELYEFFLENSSRKLMFFPEPEIEITVSADEIIVIATTSKNHMDIVVEKEFPLEIIETKIRKETILEGVLDGVN